MLEQSTLLLHGWIGTSLQDGQHAWIRTIGDHAGRPLGFARFAGDPNSSWFSWLRTIRLDVYETQDDALLMSVTRWWGVPRIWEVEDADERRIGSVHTKIIVSSMGDRLGYLDQHDGAGSVLDPTGHMLMRYAKSDGAVELVFAQNPADNPFLRMLMLGSVLVLDPTPK